MQYLKTEVAKVKPTRVRSLTLQCILEYAWKKVEGGYLLASVWVR